MGELFMCFRGDVSLRRGRWLTLRQRMMKDVMCTLEVRVFIGDIDSIHEQYIEHFSLLISKPSFPYQCFLV